MFLFATAPTLPPTGVALEVLYTVAFLSFANMLASIVAGFFALWVIWKARFWIIAFVTGGWSAVGKKLAVQVVTKKVAGE